MDDIKLPLILKENPVTKQDWKYYLSFESPFDYIDEIRNGLKQANRYFVDIRFRKLFFWLLTNPMAVNYFQQYIYSTTEAPHTIFYRARIYNPGDPIGQEPNFRGYDKAGSFVPPEKIISPAGRINPDGIKYLYTASDIATAIAEVNPHIGNKISVAKITIKQPLHIFNIAINDCGIDVPHFPAASDWLQKFVLGLSLTFQQPYSQNGNYYLCQYISEFVKLWGFDGICHYSSKINADDKDCIGKNYIIFNTDKCEPISSELYHIADMKIDFFHM